MSAPPTLYGTEDVPTQVFEAFIRALEAGKVDQGVVSRIKKALLEEATYSDRTLRKAVLGEEVEP